MVAACRLGSEDLNAWLVGQGHALAYRRYSTAYTRQEDEAKAAKRGVWAGQFTPPWEWRQGTRDAAAAPAAPATSHLASPPASPAVAPRSAGISPSPNGCLVKGNVNASGDRLFHVPGGRDYERTTITTSKGERWFCSADEATAAGWRAAR